MIIATRRGISQIIGTLFMVAIVVSVGSVLLFTGIENITSFNSFLEIIKNTETDKINESFIIEHVRFDPVDGATTGEEIELSVRNTGSVDITIERIAIHQIENQNLIIYDTDPNLTIFSGEMETKALSDWLNGGIAGSKETNAGVCGSTSSSGAGIGINDFDSNCNAYATKQYRIVVTTTKGTTVETIAKPFNT